ncbi:hypothetical protein Sros01_29580 [Streptomyces roseochromogenus]|nr:hypothetical protein Sros01_29580 [Streptomyces roseochromogenus]
MVRAVHGPALLSQVDARQSVAPLMDSRSQAMDASTAPKVRGNRPQQVEAISTARHGSSLHQAAPCFRRALRINSVDPQAPDGPAGTLRTRVPIRAASALSIARHSDSSQTIIQWLLE